MRRPDRPDAAGPVVGEESLVELLGGGQAALDATVPPLVFVVGWLVSDGSVGVAAMVSVAVTAAIAVWRLARGRPPRAVLIGLLGVTVAAGIAMYTGRAADFFLVQIVGNVASALAWTLSIVLRWPLLGLVVGGLLGQGGVWRRDPALLRAYSRASWIWVIQYVIRVVVFVPLWWAEQVLFLGVARVVLTWPLVLGCLILSWWVVRRSLPEDHPGLRHPRAEPADSPARPDR